MKISDDSIHALFAIRVTFHQLLDEYALFIEHLKFNWERYREGEYVCAIGFFRQYFFLHVIDFRDWRRQEKSISHTSPRKSYAITRQFQIIFLVVRDKIVHAFYLWMCKCLAFCRVTQKMFSFLFRFIFFLNIQFIHFVIWWQINVIKMCLCDSFSNCVVGWRFINYVFRYCCWLVSIVVVFLHVNASAMLFDKCVEICFHVKFDLCV